VGQKDQSYCIYNVTHKNSKTQKQKKMFSIWIRGLSESFDGLNSSPGQSAEELWTCKNTLKLLC